ncbi:hypothetical protein [Actinoplanes sp. L3-i22]|uniref:hypothetical protein n=1 Tax=Actinoplanes sp. L3-i22 TaxID=2836373 RepID=UPI001C84D209|nr:hypothetical protein [Actinoplanes sp. L3-i22]
MDAVAGLGEHGGVADVDVARSVQGELGLDLDADRPRVVRVEIDLGRGAAFGGDRLGDRAVFDRLAGVVGLVRVPLGGAGGPGVVRVRGEVRASASADDLRAGDEDVAVRGGPGRSARGIDAYAGEVLP